MSTGAPANPFNFPEPDIDLLVDGDLPLEEMTVCGDYTVNLKSYAKSGIHEVILTGPKTQIFTFRNLEDAQRGYDRISAAINSRYQIVGARGEGELVLVTGMTHELVMQEVAAKVRNLLR